MSKIIHPTLQGHDGVRWAHQLGGLVLPVVYLELNSVAWGCCNWLFFWERKRSLGDIKGLLLPVMYMSWEPVVFVMNPFWKRLEWQSSRVHDSFGGDWNENVCLHDGVDLAAAVGVS